MSVKVHLLRTSIRSLVPPPPTHHEFSPVAHREYAQLQQVSVCEEEQSLPCDVVLGKQLRILAPAARERVLYNIDEQLLYYTCSVCATYSIFEQL